ncbi:1,4-alpha-glucan branching enzyme GlgB [Streptomyces griseus subsp. griseus]
MTARKPSRKGSRKTAEPPVEIPVEASVDVAAAPATASTTTKAARAGRARPRPADAGPPRPRAGDGQGARPAPALDGADRGRLLAGDHHAPHDVLGAHPIPGGVLVRALRPFARSVTVLATGLRAELHEDGDGFFSGVLPVPEVPAYRLEVAYDDNTIEVEDAYRFWPAIGEARSAPDRRGPARGAVAGARRGADGAPGRFRHPVHPLGAERPRGAGHR